MGERFLGTTMRGAYVGFPRPIRACARHGLLSPVPFPHTNAQARALWTVIPGTILSVPKGEHKNRRLNKLPLVETCRNTDEIRTLCWRHPSETAAQHHA